MLADTFARNDLGSGTDAIQLRDEIAEALWPVSATKLPDVCQAFGLEDGDVDEAMGSKRAYVRSRTSDYTLDQLVGSCTCVSGARWTATASPRTHPAQSARCSAHTASCLANTALTCRH